MKKTIFVISFLFFATLSWAQTDFAHGFSSASEEASSTGNGSISYTFGQPFYGQPSNAEGYSLSEGVMHAQLIRVDMVLASCQNDSLAVSPAHVKDSSGFFQGYDGTDIVFKDKTINVFPAGTYDSTAYENLHYNWNSQYNYDSLTTLLLEVYPIYELYDTLFLDSTEIVSDYARNVLMIPDPAWHQLHGGPNEYELKTVGHDCDSIRHFFVKLCGGTIKDADGNEYSSVYLGTAPDRHCWTKSNFKTTTNFDGKAIPNKIYYAEEHADTNFNLSTYGRLYDWYAAVNLLDDKNGTPAKTTHGGFVTGICPSGWHIPDSANLISLSTVDAYDAMANTLWLIPGNDAGAGFYALPAGLYFDAASRYENMLGITYFWSSVKHSYSECWVCSLTYGCNKFILDDISADNGVSVRCVKNQMFDDDGNELND
jgi:uncharacterized protein (TIGR02145 family)